MKIKLLKNCNYINKGTILPVRKISSLEDVVSYQVIDGPHIGLILKGNSFNFLEINDKYYSETEWNDMRKFFLAELEKEREKSNQRHELVNTLTSQLSKKNEEMVKLNLLLNALLKALNIAGETTRDIRTKKKDFLH